MKKYKMWWWFMYFFVLTWASLVGHYYVSIYISYMCTLTFLFTSFSDGMKLLILNMNGVLCYFPHIVVLQGKQHVKGRNIDRNKEEARVGVQHFIIQAFKEITLLFCLVCWSRMSWKFLLMGTFKIKGATKCVTTLYILMICWIFFIKFHNWLMFCN